MIKNEIVINEILQENTKLPISVFDKDYTKTTLFLLNMFGYRYRNMPVYFINAYIGDGEFKTEFEYPVLMLFKTDIDMNHRDKSWVHFEKSILEHPSYRYTYYAGKEEEYDLIMYVFEVPQPFEADYLKFIEGKYSEFSEEYKAIFPKQTIANGQAKTSLHFKVIQKDPELKAELESMLGTTFEDDYELWEKPKLDREIFRY